MHGLVVSHLDCVNSLLYRVPYVEIKKMQQVQNLAARLTLSRAKYDSNSQCLINLQWLPIQKRIEFKFLILVYNSLDHCAPWYFQELCKEKRSQETRTPLRISIQGPRSRGYKKKNFCRQSISCYRPKTVEHFIYSSKTSQQHWRIQN